MSKFDRIGRIPAVAVAVALAVVSFVLASCAKGTTDESPHPVANAATVVPDSSAPAYREALGCRLDESPYKPGVSVRGTMLAGEEAGGQRRFRVYVPTSYRPGRPMPLVMMFHGVVSDPVKIQNKLSFMNDVAEREGFLVVWPEGKGRIHAWNAGACCGTAMEVDLDDVRFVRKLLELIDDQLCVDHDRVHAAGMSNGGIFTLRLACEMSDALASVGVVAGTDTVLDCAPSSPVSVLQIHGSEDLIVPYNGGLGCGIFQIDFPSVATAQTAWAERLGCVGEPEPWTGTSDTECTLRAGCPAGVDLGLCTVAGGGHQWPGKGEEIYYNDCPEDGDKTESFAASELLWDFFQSHPKVRLSR